MTGFPTIKYPHQCNTDRPPAATKRVQSIRSYPNGAFVSETITGTPRCVGCGDTYIRVYPKEEL